MKHVPKFEKLEICLTYRCNVKCNNCVVQCTQAPAGKEYDLPLDKLKNMLDESISIGKIWKEIRLTGGEPTLHDNFIECCKLVADYKLKTPGCNYIGVLSNGINEKQLNEAKALGFNLDVSKKLKTNARPNGDKISYDPINVSPADLGNEYNKGCFLPILCGQYFNYLGFFVCSAAAGAARVFNYQSLGTSVSSISTDKAIASYNIVCENCGYANPGYENGPNTSKRIYEQVTSEIWDKKLKLYIEKNNQEKK